MKPLLLPLGAIGLIAAGVTGKWSDITPLAPYAIWLLAMGLAMLGYVALKTTYYQSETPWPANSDPPRPLHLTWLDYLKAVVCWFDAFKRTYAIEPGLYYTGQHYDREAPLLVTSNYLLTVFLVVRRIRAFNARLLIIDTDGINVWCAAGKGQFSDAEIRKQLDRYDRELLTHDTWLTLILPKFSLSGVELRALRRAKIRPLIGPLHAKDLPAYLANPPLQDRDEDRVRFGLQARIFTWLPGLVQFLGYGLVAVIVLLGVELAFGIPAPLGLLGIAALLATAYPILFPWLPGVRFAVKGIWLATFTSLGLSALNVGGILPPSDLIMAVLFTFASAIFFALAYTGNSAVSNYSRVRQEIARFLPLDVLLYLGSLAAFVLKGVLR